MNGAAGGFDGVILPCGDNKAAVDADSVLWNNYRIEYQ